MSGKWYHSRTNQAALITGIFGLAIAIVVSILSSERRDPYPAIEIKNLTPTGEEVLARLAVTPSRQLMDSSAFAALRSRDVIVNDSLGVLIARPSGYEWGVGDFGELEKISVDDVAVFRWISGMLERGFPQDTAMPVRYFGVRLDEPARITLTAESRLDSTRVGTNPFRNTRYALGLMRMIYGDYLNQVPEDELAAGQAEMIRTIDSVTRADFPSKRQIFNGVFVARVGPTARRYAEFLSWLKTSPLQHALSVVRVSSRPPSFLVVDSDRGTLLFSDAVLIEDALVNGRIVPAVTLNRAGYMVKTGATVHVVMLQYVSTAPREVLAELERFLSSVRILKEPP